MTMILDEIAEKRRERVAAAKQQVPMQQMQEAAKQPFPHPSFIEALKQPGISFICEVKRASPSKGVIAETFPYLEIAQAYEAAGAAAISVLSEPDYFHGKKEYVKEIAQQCQIPVLQKDFIIDPYQIYEAKTLGASAILLICALLSVEQLAAYRKLAESLGMDALVETHDIQEIQMALSSGAKIIGVNNRNLKTFAVDLATSIQLRDLIPSSIVFVSESGIRNRADIIALENNDTDAVLIGETLMRSSDKKKMIAQLRGELL